MSELNFENEPVTELEPDEPPKNGVWAEEHPEPSEEETEEGRRLGEELEDDYDEEFDDE